MKENFLNLVMEIDMQVQEAQRVPNKMDANRPTPRHITIKMPKVKHKERILKAVNEEQFLTYRRVPIRLSTDFSKETKASRGHCRNFAGQTRLARHIQSHEKQGPTAKITLPSKAIIQNQRADKVLPRQGKPKGVPHHQTIII